MLRLNTSLFRNSLTSLWDDGVSTPWAAFALIQHENGDSRGQLGRYNMLRVRGYGVK